MKKVHLEYSDMMVGLPSIEFFINKIENNENYQFLRTNHAIFDLIYTAYNVNNVFQLSEFKSDLESKDYRKISEKVYKFSDKEYNNSWNIYHKGSSELINKFEIYLKVFDEYKDISNVIDIGVSLGVGLNQYWGVFAKENPIQKARQLTFGIFYDKSKYEYYYSGVLKYFSVTDEIFKLFDSINNNNYNVVFVGRDYMRLYKDKFNIENFYHINIPNRGAIEFVDDYVEEIKDICKTKKTIVFYSIGHVLTFYMAHQLKDENIIGIDIGRSFDILLREKLDTEPSLPKCWITLNKEQLKAHINRVRNG
jgi:hypothetical protein